MKNNYVYLFYYEFSTIVDHDDDGAVYGMERVNLGGFFDFQTGKEFYEHKHPRRNIQYDIIKIEDAGE